MSGDHDYDELVEIIEALPEDVRREAERILEEHDARIDEKFDFLEDQFDRKAEDLKRAIGTYQAVQEAIDTVREESEATRDRIETAERLLSDEHGDIFDRIEEAENTLSSEHDDLSDEHDELAEQIEELEQLTSEQLADIFEGIGVLQYNDQELQDAVADHRGEFQDFLAEYEDDIEDLNEGQRRILGAALANYSELDEFRQQHGADMDELRDYLQELEDADDQIIRTLDDHTDSFQEFLQAFHAFRTVYDGDMDELKQNDAEMLRALTEHADDFEEYADDFAEFRDDILAELMLEKELARDREEDFRHQQLALQRALENRNWENVAALMGYKDRQQQQTEFKHNLQNLAYGAMLASMGGDPDMDVAMPFFERMAQYSGGALSGVEQDQLPDGHAMRIMADDGMPVSDPTTGISHGSGGGEYIGEVVSAVTRMTREITRYVQEATGDMNAVDEFYSTAFENIPEFRTALYRQRNDGAIDDYGRQQLEDTMEDYSRELNTALREGDIDRVMTLYDDITSEEMVEWAFSDEAA